jgi:hypothetical protein
LDPGDYIIRITAYAVDLLALYSQHLTAPSLTPQRVSQYSLTFPVGGLQHSSSYSLAAASGILNYGASGPGGPIYGLAIWTSIQDITNQQQPAAPAGDWNIVIQDPNGLTMNYIYPATDNHYAYWYYGVEPVAGTYTVTASYGAASKTTAFVLSNTTPALNPLSYNQIGAALVSNVPNTSVNDINISWPLVPGSKSYYVSLWSDVWDSFTNQYEYSEVWGQWVKDSGNATTSVRALYGTIEYNGSILHNIPADVYVTAYQVDMTSTSVPNPVPSRADMSENYYGYPLPFSTP